MAFGLYCLAINPDVQMKVRDEVDSVLKKYGGELTFDGVQEMAYLDLAVSGKITIHSSGPIQPPIQRVQGTPSPRIKRPELEADHSSLSSKLKVKDIADHVLFLTEHHNMKAIWSGGIAPLIL